MFPHQAWTSSIFTLDHIIGYIIHWTTSNWCLPNHIAYARINAMVYNSTTIYYIFYCCYWMCIFERFTECVLHLLFFLYWVKVSFVIYQINCPTPSVFFSSQLSATVITFKLPQMMLRKSLIGKTHLQSWLRYHSSQHVFFFRFELATSQMISSVSKCLWSSLT